MAGFFDVGDYVRVIDNTYLEPYGIKAGETGVVAVGVHLGAVVVHMDEYHKEVVGWGNEDTVPGHTLWIEEDKLEIASMSGAKHKNPKNFRNGDVIKITPKGGTDAVVFVKFGENYYNLSEGGQMKAYKYLPHGNREVIASLSGMGRFFLMSEEELEKQTEKKNEWIVADGDSKKVEPVEELQRILHEWERGLTKNIAVPYDDGSTVTYESKTFTYE